MVGYRSWISLNFSFLFFRISGPTSLPADQPRNLPYLTAHFVGRDVEVDEILTKL